MTEKSLIIGIVDSAMATRTIIAVSLFALLLVSSCGKHADYQALNGVWERKFDNGQGYAVLIVENGHTQYAFFHSNDNSGQFQPKTRLDLDTSKDPRQFDTIDLASSNANSELNNSMRGIYLVEGSRLKLAFEDKTGNARPTSFTLENTYWFDRKGDSVDFKPKDPNYLKGLSTWAYMKKLSGILQPDSSLNFDNVKTIPEGLAMIDKASKALAEVGTKVTKLPVSDVDNRATAFGSEYSQITARGASLLEQMGQVVKELNDLAIRRNSDEAAGKAFLEWLFGNPGQTMGELDAEFQQLKARFDKLQAEGKTFEASISKKDQEGVQLRSALSQTYGREYPAIKN